MEKRSNQPPPTLNNGASGTSLNLSAIPAGQYLVRMVTGGASLVEKLVVR